MKYDFTSIMDRRGKDAIAVDALGAPGFAPGAPKEGFDAIPMWVADMNFPTVPTIPEAIIARARHPAYGYFSPTEEYFASIIRWHETRNGVTGLTKECIGYENGVLGGVVSALNIFCSRGDNVLLHSPTYIGFTHSLENNGYNIVHSPLVKDENNVWRMDFEDMEKKDRGQQGPRRRVLLAPQPLRPRVGALGAGARHGAVQKARCNGRVRRDLVGHHPRWAQAYPPRRASARTPAAAPLPYTPPSKTFNLAGLVGSYHIIYNPVLRDRVEKEASLSHYNSMNVLSMHALLGAYRPEGYEWVDELCQVLTANVDFACDFIARRFEGVEVSRPQGTYMLFLDCTRWCEAHGKSIEALQRAGWDVGVAWQDGRPFRGPCHIRMNLALPLSRVQEAFRRLDEYVFNA